MSRGKADKVRLVAASSSKNARAMLKRIDLCGLVASRGWPYAFIEEGDRLYDLFDVDVCGRTFKYGKPHPEIFLTAASELGVPPKSCVVFEDAISGVQAVKRGGMFCRDVLRGVVRIGTSEDLRDAGADVVVGDLDEVSYRALKERVIGVASNEV